jgi:hypothetical protein
MLRRRCGRSLHAGVRGRMLRSHACSSSCEHTHTHTHTHSEDAERAFVKLVLRIQQWEPLLARVFVESHCVTERMCSHARTDVPTHLVCTCACAYACAMFVYTLIIVCAPTAVRTCVLVGQSACGPTSVNVPSCNHARARIHA